MNDQESIDVLNSIIPPLKKIDLTQDKIDSNKACPAQIHPQPLSNGCPFFNGKGVSKQNSVPNKKFHEWQTSISITSEPCLYQDYLYLDQVLDAQYPLSKKYGTEVHDEHLFIVTHQGTFILF